MCCAFGILLIILAVVMFFYPLIYEYTGCQDSWGSDIVMISSLFVLVFGICVYQAG